MRIFCELRSIPPPPEKYEQWPKYPLVLYAKPSNKRLIIPLQKELLFYNWRLFLVRVIRKILIPSVRMTLTMSKMFPRIICQTIESEVNYSTARKKKCYFGFYFLVRVSKTSYSSAIVAPFASAGIRPEVNRLNHDTTMYYGLVFCALSWPCMVKWQNSGIIIIYYYLYVIFSNFKDFALDVHLNMQ